MSTAEYSRLYYAKNRDRLREYKRLKKQKWDKEQRALKALQPYVTRVHSGQTSLDLMDKVLENIQTATCSRCKLVLPVESFYIDLRRMRPHAHCKSCRSEISAISRRSLKREALDHYGGCCACCGESGEVFLTIDHIDGDGAKHRRDNSISTGLSTYSWLKRNGYPVGFQVLCWNCNSAKAILGRCPHSE